MRFRLATAAALACFALVCTACNPDDPGQPSNDSVGSEGTRQLPSAIDRPPPLPGVDLQMPDFTLETRRFREGRLESVTRQRVRARDFQRPRSLVPLALIPNTPVDSIAVGQMVGSLVEQNLASKTQVLSDGQPLTVAGPQGPTRFNDFTFYRPGKGVRVVATVQTTSTGAKNLTALRMDQSTNGTVTIQQIATFDAPGYPVDGGGGGGGTPPLAKQNPCMDYVVNMMVAATEFATYVEIMPPRAVFAWAILMYNFYQWL